jgi:hypothetical protein
MKTRLFRNGVMREAVVRLWFEGGTEGRRRAVDLAGAALDLQ